VTSQGPRGRAAVLAVLVIVGLAAAGSGGYGLYGQLTRHATTAEAAAAGRQEIATRWLRMTAGQVFPATVPYTGTASGTAWSARLIGIAPRAACAAVTDPAIGAVLERAGCRAMLRATYADTSGALMATFGIAAMPSTAAAAGTLPKVGAIQHAGVDAAGFPGTASGLFGNPQRAVFGARVLGPYLVFFSVGFADGRVTHAADNDTPLLDLGDGVAMALAITLNTVGDPCRQKDIRC